MHCISVTLHVDDRVLTLGATLVSTCSLQPALSINFVRYMYELQKVANVGKFAPR